MIGPKVSPIKPVRAKTDAIPQTLFLRAEVRKSNPKYPTKVIKIPGCGNLNIIEIPAVAALKSSVIDNRT